MIEAKRSRVQRQRFDCRCHYWAFRWIAGSHVSCLISCVHLGVFGAHAGQGRCHCCRCRQSRQGAVIGHRASAWQLRWLSALLMPFDAWTAHWWPRLDGLAKRLRRLFKNTQQQNCFNFNFSASLHDQLTRARHIFNSAQPLRLQARQTHVYVQRAENEHMRAGARRLKCTMAWTAERQAATAADD